MERSEIRERQSRIALRFMRATFGEASLTLPLFPEARRGLLQDRNHTIDDNVNGSSRRKLNLLLLVPDPIPIRMHAMTDDLIEVLVLVNIPD